mmetsp:Transcript_19065/g.59182  ORF Transcript_19065/g.59182 Transcript_19065/m.59182 type:complete len:258 (-) Transcript_19065:47-820(-)
MTTVAPTATAVQEDVASVPHEDAATARMDCDGKTAVCRHSALCASHTHTLPSSPALSSVTCPTASEPKRSMRTQSECPASTSGDPTRPSASAVYVGASHTAMLPSTQPVATSPAGVTSTAITCAAWLSNTVCVSSRAPRPASHGIAAVTWNPFPRDTTRCDGPQATSAMSPAFSSSRCSVWSPVMHGPACRTVRLSRDAHTTPSAGSTKSQKANTHERGASARSVAVTACATRKRCPPARARRASLRSKLAAADDGI